LYVINLAVQDFLKAIKGVAVEDDADEYLKDEEDNDDEQEPEGFAGTLWKIRSTVKVYLKYNIHTDYRKFQQALSALRDLDNAVILQKSDH